MLAMRDEEMFMLLAFLSFVAWVIWLQVRNGLRRENLKTIQSVVESGKLDEQTRDRLIDALAQDQRRTNEFLRWLGKNAPRMLRMVVVGGGWICLVISTVVFVAMLSTGAYHRDVFAAAVGMGVGFALVTLPMALREVEGRRTTA